jgi:hypothetical protein
VFSGASNFAITLNSLLPVELTSFAGARAGKQVVLSWETATEINNAGWYVEYRTGSDVWHSAGFLRGAGNSNATKLYRFEVTSPSNANIFFRLRQVDFDGTIHFSKIIEIAPLSAPQVFRLEQNYPNPFNPVTTIAFALPARAEASLAVYNQLGQMVTKLADGTLDAGAYSFIWNAADMPSGIYYYELKAGNFRAIKKLVLMK